MESALPAIASPCIRRCALDETGGYCTGCLRTIDEIVCWTQLDDNARRTVLARIDRRRTELDSRVADPRGADQR